MTWTDYPGGSVRDDGARVGEFCVDGRFEWWGYPSGYRPRHSNPELVQCPFETRGQAKYAMDTAIPFPVEIPA